MATHRSAEKRNRQNIKRRVRNRNAKAAIRTAIRKVSDAVTAGQFDEAKSSLVHVEKLLAKAANKGRLPPGKARRTLSRLSRRVNNVQAGK